MIVYQKKFIRIAEMWGGEHLPVTVKADLIRYYQRDAPIVNAKSREIFTILIDLTREAEILLADMKKYTAYEIKRAIKKDNFIYRSWNGNRPDILTQFCKFYTEFAANRNLPKMNHNWLSLMAEGSNMYISQVSERLTNYVSWHIYYKTESRATLLYSISSFRSSEDSSARNRMGRANRFHHWQDMLKFKDENTPVYDLGGWYNGTSNLQLLKINKFKEEFGGKIVKDYICEQSLTLKARMFLRLRRLMTRDKL